MSPTPTVPVEKVAPIVFDLLVDGVPVSHIELALTEAKSHTRPGIDYMLRTLVPRNAGMKPTMRPVEIDETPPPTEEQKAFAHEAIAEMRKLLRGG